MIFNYGFCYMKNKTRYHNSGFQILFFKGHC
jgi:hypothetical protein